MGKKFRAEIGGSSWAHGPVAEFNKLSEVRKWASEYGDTADWCSVYRGERLVAQYRRDTSGDGRKWYRAEICRS